MRFSGLVLFLIGIFYSHAQNVSKMTSVVVCLKNTTIDADLDSFLKMNNSELVQFIPISDEKIEDLSKQAIKNAKSDYYVRKLRAIYEVNFNVQPNDVNQFIQNLKSFTNVEYCYLRRNDIIKPPTDITPTTISYEGSQNYIGANPGVDMLYAWNLGFSGSGIKIRNIEYGFNPNHEELNSVNVSIASGMTISSSATTAYTEHGTSVFGIIMADKGTYGVSGLAYNAQEMVLYPEWQQSGYNRVFAVSQAIANSQLGDVIIFEMQAYDAGSNLMPAEYDMVIWNLTKAATDAGIIIVAAAANGTRNLDSATYSEYMSRGNSGAILVGAGTSNVNHDRLSYSNYGTRVDMQGWGENVLTSGFTGSYFTVGGDLNQSYTNFGGTSSATPMVASCVVVLQSYYHSLTGNYMLPSEMRTLLFNTGIAQGTSVAGNIGRFPNMQAAILSINAMLNVESFVNFQVDFFPNPCIDKLNYHIPNSSDANEISFKLYDVFGRKVKEEITHQFDGILEINNLPSGVYFLKTKMNGKEQVDKIIKK